MWQTKRSFTIDIVPFWLLFLKAEVVYQRWHWGDTPLLCHLHSPLQAIFIIISSLSISAIAMDRAIVICFINVENWTTRWNVKRWMRLNCKSFAFTKYLMNLLTNIELSQKHTHISHLYSFVVWSVLMIWYMQYLCIYFLTIQFSFWRFPIDVCMMYDK